MAPTGRDIIIESLTGFPQALEIMENLEITKKIPSMEKSWNLKKKHIKIIMEKSQILLNNLTKLTVAGKLAVRHTKLVCLTASFLATGGFKF